MIIPSERHYDLDWIRVLVVIMLIPFHTAMTYAPFPWYLRNNEINLATQALIQVLDQYHMELLFLVAGAATLFSLGIRTGKSYLVERLKRLVVPLIFGMLVVVPPCYYVVARSFYFYRDSFWQWYPTFITSNIIPFQSDFQAGALWFLWYLVLYTAVLFPIFYIVRKKISTSLLSKLANFFSHRGAIFLLVIPIALVEIYCTWTITSDFVVPYYALFFIYGFLLFSEKEFQYGIERSGPIALVGAVITMTLFMLIAFPSWDKSVLGFTFWTNLGSEPGTVGFILYRILISITTWFWIVGILYLAKKFLSFNNRLLQYGSEAVLPYYILHSTFIAYIGMYVISWDMDVLSKYVINTVLAFAATAICYEILRRFNTTRFLFGMRLKKSTNGE